MNQYERIHQLRDKYSVSELCDALEVSRSGYYAWIDRPPSKRALENAEAIDAMKQIHADPELDSYGSPRMTTELDEVHGIKFSENRVARLMKQAEISAKGKRKFRPRTTVQNPNHESRIAPNHLAEIEEVHRPGQVLVADITYIPTREGWMYLAVVMDLFSRCIVGWRLAEHMKTSIVTGAFQDSLGFGLHGSVDYFHSDRGCQYTSRALHAQLVSHGISPSMSGAGYCYDNAACESFFATLKTEALPENGAFESRHQARRKLFGWIETFYNRRRRHSSLGNQSPQQFLDQYPQTKLTLN